ncbi:hypothetical protein ACFVOO_23960 [Streptomyces rochei]
MTGTWLFIGFIAGWAWGLLVSWIQTRQADRRWGGEKTGGQP